MGLLREVTGLPKGDIDARLVFVSAIDVAQLQLAATTAVYQPANFFDQLRWSETAVGTYPSERQTKTGYTR